MLGSKLNGKEPFVFDGGASLGHVVGNKWFQQCIFAFETRTFIPRPQKSPLAPTYMVITIAKTFSFWVWAPFFFVQLKLQKKAEFFSISVFLGLMATAKTNRKVASFSFCGIGTPTGKLNHRKVRAYTFQDYSLPGSDSDFNFIWGH